MKKTSSDIVKDIERAIARAREDGARVGRRQVLGALTQTLDSLLRDEEARSAPAADARQTLAKEKPAHWCASVNLEPSKRTYTRRGAVHHYGLHWTQKPENRKLMDKVISKMNAGKKSTKPHWTKRMTPAQRAAWSRKMLRAKQAIAAASVK